MAEAHWYVIHTYSGQEARAKQALLERARQFGREEAIEEVFIPEEDVVEVVSHFLEQEGYTVQKAHDGEEALEKQPRTST